MFKPAILVAIFVATLAAPSPSSSKECAPGCVSALLPGCFGCSFGVVGGGVAGAGGANGAGGLPLARPTPAVSIPGPTPAATIPSPTPAVSAPSPPSNGVADTNGETPTIVAPTPAPSVPSQATNGVDTNGQAPVNGSTSETPQPSNGDQGGNGTNGSTTAVPDNGSQGNGQTNGQDTPANASTNGQPAA
ncbi:hypothetical protein AeNC1_018583 [Aphanomyces euteiches]|nr:hypothetical protein AeNC1_018583 [Aphanomyces euteiches]